MEQDIADLENAESSGASDQNTVTNFPSWAGRVTLPD
jgi:hypothetical protein